MVVSGAVFVVEWVKLNNAGGPFIVLERFYNLIRWQGSGPGRRRAGAGAGAGGKGEAGHVNWQQRT